MPHIPMKHALVVTVVPGNVIQTPSGKRAFGLFRASGNGIEICIAGTPIRNMTTIDDIERTLCHEFAHYEQFRDGRRLQERGVKVRAENLRRKALAA